jgi:glycosyltransferase involved in cell wall biosynthesis
VARLALNAPTTLADLIVYNSQTSRSVGRRGPARLRPSTVVHNGVTGPTESAPPRLALDPPVTLLYVGRLSPRKGVDVAVQALAHVRADGVDARLVMVGSVFPGYEWYEEQLHDLAGRLGVERECVFVGFQDSVWPWLADADIAVVPSRSDESFGNTVVEAALAARPVVVSDHSGLREARAGLGAAVPVPVDDAPALASAVGQLVRDWGRTRAAAVADAAYARTTYAPTRYQDDVVAALASVARVPRTGRLSGVRRRRPR